MAMLVLSFSSAFAGGPAPQFGITTGEIKLGDTYLDNWRVGYHGLIVDGMNVYSVRGYPEKVGGSVLGIEVVMDQSSDGGLTWQNSVGIARDPNILGQGSLIAINPVTKALHYAWNTYEPLLTPSWNLYYGNGTTTTRVNGSLDVQTYADSSMAVDGTGVIHFVFTASDTAVYYTSSSDNGVTFSAPAAIPGAFGWSQFTADSAGNLYLVDSNNSTNAYFLRKPAGGQWSNPVAVCTNCARNDPSIAVYDSNRIYLQWGDIIAATSNGGVNWTVSPVPAGSIWGGILAVSSDGLLNYAFMATDGVYFARTTKSFDPTSWGPAVLVFRGAIEPNVAVDSAGKAYIAATKNYSDNSVIVFTKEK